MAKEDIIKVRGEIVAVNNSRSFKVKLENGIEVSATVSGKMSKNKISILPGDIVDVELSPYDLTQGRIVYRAK